MCYKGKAAKGQRISIAEQPLGGASAGGGGAWQFTGRATEKGHMSYKIQAFRKRGARGNVRNFNNTRKDGPVQLDQQNDAVYRKWII
jgi:hypothetical protein